MAAKRLMETISVHYQPLDSSNRQQAYLLVSEEERYIQLSANAYHLLQLVEEGNSYAAIARQIGPEVTDEMVQTAHQSLLQQIESIHQTPRRTRHFWFKAPLLSAHLTRQIVRGLIWMFRPGVSPVLLFLAVLVFVGVALQLPTDGVSGNSAVFGLAYIFFLVSILCHEFGHAAAAAYYDTPPNRIGVAIYLIYPVFYSDVNPVWRLPRKRRVVVNLGGIYFQILVGAIYAITYQLTRWQPLYIALLMIASSCIFSLNPIFKFDGYWVLSDALGVTNLHQQLKRVIRYLWHRAIRRPAAALPWPLPVIAGLIIYAALTIGVWLYFIPVLAAYFWHTLRAYPAVARLFVEQAAHTILTADAARDFLVATFVILTMCLIIFRLMSFVVSLLRARWSPIKANE